MNYLLQVRRPHGRYQTIVSSRELTGLAWGWQQCVDPRYSAGTHVRIVDVSGGTLKLVRRVKVGEP